MAEPEYSTKLCRRSEYVSIYDTSVNRIGRNKLINRLNVLNGKNKAWLAKSIQGQLQNSGARLHFSQITDPKQKQLWFWMNRITCWLSLRNSELFLVWLNFNFNWCTNNLIWPNIEEWPYLMTNNYFLAVSFYIEIYEFKLKLNCHQRFIMLLKLTNLF